MKYFTLGKIFPLVGNLFFFCRDLYHLQPVRAKPIFTFNETETTEEFICSDLWQTFRLAELDQIMRQGNEKFINLLNKIRIGQIDQNIEYVIKSRFIDKDNTSYPRLVALHQYFN